MFLILSLLCSSLGYADYSFSRTAQDPMVFSGDDNVSIYRTECHSHEEYGTDSSCGSYQQCSYSLMNSLSARPLVLAALRPRDRDHRDDSSSDTRPRDRDHRDDSSSDTRPRDRDHRDGGSSSGGSSSGGSSSDSGSSYEPTPTCYTQYNQCWHTETSCTQVLDRVVTVRVELTLDHRAILPPGARESLKLSLEGTGELRRFVVSASGSAYGYTLEGDTDVSLSVPKDVYVLSAVMTSVSPKIAENQIKIRGAGYTSRGTFAVHFTDPLLTVPELTRAFYKIELKQGKHRRVAGTFTSAKLDSKNGVYTIEVYPGETEWRSYPNKTSHDQFVLSMQVRPEVYFLKNAYSKAKLTKLFKPFP